MKFTPVTGLVESDLEALALKLLGTQDAVADHNDAGVDNSDLEDDLYEGGFAATCSYCGFWVRPDTLDADDICEGCIEQIESDEQDEMDDVDLVDDDRADVTDYNYHMPDGEDWGFDGLDLDDDDDLNEEDWDDADLDGIDDFDWEEDND